MVRIVDFRYHLVSIVAATDLPVTTALGVGNTAGMTLAGVLLLRGLHRAAGPPALAGAARAGLAGLLGAAAAVAVGALLPVPRDTAPLPSVGTGVLLAAVAGTAYLLVVRALDPAGVKALVRRG